ncbi:MAG: hypothetical protein U0670_17245 [Anaerolineae bacterium]
MTDERTNLPMDDAGSGMVPGGDAPVEDFQPTDLPAAEAPAAPVEPAASTANSTPTDSYEERLERLGGEPAPVITPEEFARLQKAGQVHIDERGRVRTARREDEDGGVSLKKRRAWYAQT